MTTASPFGGIAVRHVPRCIACRAPGVPLYRGLQDRLYHVPGRWDISRCSDRRCGLLWLDPMPREDEILGLYPADYYTHEEQDSEPLTAGGPPRAQQLIDAVTQRYLAARYGSEPASWSTKAIATLLHLHPPRRVEADAYLMYLRARPGARLLDVGCGDGEFVERMAAFGWQVQGVEADPRAAERARKRGVAVRAGTLEEAAFPPDSFDAITMSHVIEHVTDPADLLALCLRVLKPGGELIVVTPNARSLGHHRFGPAWFPLEPPRHLYVFTVPALRRLSRAAGLKASKVWTTIRYANYFMLLSRRVQKTGRSNGMAVEASLSSRAWARSVQLAEWGLCLTGSAVGEEIVLAARK